MVPINQPSALNIKNLTIRYGNTTILEDFNLQLAQGKLYVILGPSGCGKSTLLTAISGLIRPNDGQIYFNHQALFDMETKTSVPVENRNIGFVFQSYALWPHMTVYDHVAFPLSIRKMPQRDIQNRVGELLEMINLQGYENRYPNELSGGEKQRVALIRSLAYKPDLLLLDEPLANLDAHLKTELANAIKTIQRTTGITTIYVTHDQHEAFEIADEILVMKEGKLLERGTPYELYNKCSHPFTARFIGRKNLISLEDFKGYFKHTAHTCHNKCCRQLEDSSIISIPPEALHLVPASEPSCNKTYIGQLIALNYKGAFTEYTVKYHSLELLIQAPTYVEYKCGDDVRFKVDRYHMIHSKK